MSGLKKNNKPYQTQQNKVHTSPKNWPGSLIIANKYEFIIKFNYF